MRSQQSRALKGYLNYCERGPAGGPVGERLGPSAA